MQHRIEVRPFDTQSWQLACEGVANPMLFRSGAKAEAAARDLALRLADGGAGVHVVIRLRDGSLGAQFHTEARASVP